MWNYTQNSSKGQDSRSLNLDSGNLKEKVEKSLDLTIYLNYLQNLFSQSTSDSDSSDSDNEIVNESELDGTNETLGEIQYQNNSLTPLSVNNTYSNSSASTFSSSDDSDFDSSDSSNKSFVDENDILTNDMVPMSDLELQKLMRAHNSWKKNQYSIGSETDVSSILNACSQESEGGRRKKRKKSKNCSKRRHKDQSEKSSDSISHSNASVGYSGGHITKSSNYMSNNHKSNKGRSRKQSLKHVRSEEAAAAAAAVTTSTMAAAASISSENSDSATVTHNLAEPTVSLPSEIEVKQEIDCLNPDDNIVDSVNVANTSVMPANVGLIENVPESFHAFTPEDEDDGTNENSLSAGLNINSISMDDDDDDDNDSLSDYMSIAATVSATTQASLMALSQGFPKGSLTDTSSIAVPSPGMASGSSNSACSFDSKKRKYEGKDAMDSPKQRKSVAPKTAKTIEALNLKRRRIYILLCKKEIGKTQRSRVNNHKEMLVVKRRLAQACTRQQRQKAIQSQKIMKESVWRAKRLTREMQAHWKQADRIEREIRKRKDKEAEEQRKFDLELLEAKRQQRKLNFLITQTELYAHFMSKKLGGKEGDETVILNQLNEVKDERLAQIDDYDCETMKNKAKSNVHSAFLTQQTQVSAFDMDLQDRADYENDDAIVKEGESVGEFTQPKMFNGILKHYQLKGMNWLISLYDQAINGILSDEMGLGKTCQSIAFLAHVAERYNVWGPFLVIAPASTLHNWQQELKRFVPRFKVVPYWGNPQERKILRQLWQQSNLHTESASFHVVVTSYQIVVADLKYFNRIKWQYLILDEAQAIKSTSSTRWKMLLGFSCRNRLLLTGTPIQNTMGELWALLHFIMPSLFDSHDEFSEWFSKDIESHAENKSTMDERHLSRLHLILKPFMLRRIKKDVENELSDKIEVLVYCPLTSRQQLLYSMLKKRIKIDELLKSAGPSDSQLSQHATTNLMNLVMQFRKVCNHSDLFERREVKSPLYMKGITISFPKLIFRDGLLHLSFPSKRHLLQNRFNIYNSINIYESLFRTKSTHSLSGCLKDVNADKFFSEWSFLRFINMDISELYQISSRGLFARWQHNLSVLEYSSIIHHRKSWKQMDESASCYLRKDDFLLYTDLVTSWQAGKTSSIFNDLLFTSYTDSVYTFNDQTIHRIPETLEHRMLRSRKMFPYSEEPPLAPEVNHNPTVPIVRSAQKTAMPSFLYYTCPKVACTTCQVYFSDRSAAWWLLEDDFRSNQEGLNCLLYGKPKVPELTHFEAELLGGLRASKPYHGWSHQIFPDREKLITDSGKLTVLDGLLKKLKAQGHRVLIYSQMTKMIDLLEEYMWFCKWKYKRLDGSSKISERRDMVADFQTKSEIFVFLLSTRAGGLGINLTAADTVIFYDSDWNPTVDLQAADRIHRLGQTKQVTIYRLICKGTIEERILQRAQEKNEIQRMVISGGDFRSDTLKPKEVVSLLLDDEELENKYRKRQTEKKSNPDICLGESTSDTKPSTSAMAKRKVSLKSTTASGDKGTAEREKQPQYSKNSPSEMEIQCRDFISDSIPSSALNQDGSLLASVLQYDEPDSAEFEDYSEESRSSDEESVCELSSQDSSAVYDGGTSAIDWNADYNSDVDDETASVLKKPKLGRGNGKRGRPPSRVRVQPRELDGEVPLRRGPGRPRLRPIGPANQGIRGRRPGRPPLSKKAEGLGSSLTPLTASQRVFGFYSSPDMEFS